MTARRSQVIRGATGVAMAALAWATSDWAVLVEWHRAAVLPRVTATLQPLSGASTSTLGEVLAVVLVATALLALIVRRTAVLGSLGLAMGLAVVSFYLSWGLAYRYGPLSSRLAPLAATSDTASIHHLVEAAESAAGLLGRAASAAPVVDGDPVSVMARINAGLTEGMGRLPAALDASPVGGIAFGPVKISRVSFALSRLQLSGYYLPWTGEAQINGEMPQTLWPRVAAHEKAHQRGFARENEATVIGLLACLKSDDPMVLYGGALGLYAGFDRELARVDREARARIWNTLPSRAVADFKAEVAFWKAHEGAAGAVSEKVNDTYLKAQGVRSGVLSYGETTRLILQAIETESLHLAGLLRKASPERGRPEVTGIAPPPIR